MPLVRRVHRVGKEFKVLLALQDSQEPQALLGLKDSKESKVLLVSQDLPERLGRLAPKDSRESKALLVSLV